MCGRQLATLDSGCQLVQRYIDSACCMPIPWKQREDIDLMLLYNNRAFPSKWQLEAQVRKN